MSDEIVKLWNQRQNDPSNFFFVKYDPFSDKNVPLCSSSATIMTLVISGKIPNCHCLCGLFQVEPAKLSVANLPLLLSWLNASCKCSMITELKQCHSWKSSAVTTPLSHIILLLMMINLSNPKTRTAMPILHRFAAFQRQISTIRSAFRCTCTHNISATRQVDSLSRLSAIQFIQ